MTSATSIPINNYNVSDEDRDAKMRYMAATVRPERRVSDSVSDTQAIRDALWEVLKPYLDITHDETFRVFSEPIAAMLNALRETPADAPLPNLHPIPPTPGSLTDTFIAEI